MSRIYVKWIKDAIGDTVDQEIRCFNCLMAVDSPLSYSASLPGEASYSVRQETTERGQHHDLPVNGNDLPTW